VPPATAPLLAADLAGRFVLATATAPWFLPYAPAWSHSTVVVTLAADRRVRGVAVFLFPAIDYQGHVVDERGAPVAGARVRLVGTPQAEQDLDHDATD
jgi:hypothetical protein